MLISEIKTPPPSYDPYFQLVGNESLESILNKRIFKALDFYQSVPFTKWEFSYAEDKWSMKKVLHHVLDAEMIFLYRAISIARGEKQSLPSWNENEYGANLSDENIDIKRLFNAFGNQMNLTRYYFSSFNQKELERIGVSNNQEVSVAAIGFAIAGHEMHHRAVIYEKYLSI